MLLSSVYSRLFSRSLGLLKIIDVGSTGSRLHVFEFVASSSDGDAVSDANSSEERRVQCLRRGSSKAWTPLSTFASEMDDDGRLNATHVAHHMLPLFDYASIIIPPMFHSTTPVRISCTAGMRLLPLDDQNRVYDALFEGLHEQSTTGLFSFIDLRRENVFTLDGERQPSLIAPLPWSYISLTHCRNFRREGRLLRSGGCKLSTGGRRCRAKSNNERYMYKQIRNVRARCRECRLWAIPPLCSTEAQC